MAPTLMPPGGAGGPFNKKYGATATTTNRNFVKEATSDLQKKKRERRASGFVSSSSSQPTPTCRLSGTRLAPRPLSCDQNFPRVYTVTLRSDKFVEKANRNRNTQDVVLSGGSPATPATSLVPESLSPYSRAALRINYIFRVWVTDRKKETIVKASGISSPLPRSRTTTLNGSRPASLHKKVLYSSAGGGAHQLQAITKFVHTNTWRPNDMSSSSSALNFLDPMDAYRSLLTMSPHMFLSSTHQHFVIPPPRQQPVQAPPAPSTAAILEHYHVLHQQLRQQEQQLRQQQPQPDRVGSALYNKLYPQRQRHCSQSSWSRRIATTPTACYADGVAVVSPQNWSGSRELRHLPPDVLLPPLLDVSDDMMVMPPPLAVPPQPRQQQRGSSGAGAASAQPSPRQKSVRFSLQQQVFTVPNDEVEPRQWLQAEDLDRQRRADKRIVAHDEAYKSAILFLMQSFKAEHYVGRQQLLDQVRVLLEQPEARGLEHRIASVLKSKRIKAVQQFLRQQRTIRRQARRQQQQAAGNLHDRHHHHKRSSSSKPSSSSSGDLMVSLQLRQVSLKLSRGARQLAFRLAQSDRLAAKAIHEEEEEEDPSSPSALADC